MKFLVKPDFQNNQFQNSVLQLLASDPSSPAQGQFWFNTTTKLFKYYDGTQVITLTPGLASGPAANPVFLSQNFT